MKFRDTYNFDSPQNLSKPFLNIFHWTSALNTQFQYNYYVQVIFSICFLLYWSLNSCLSFLTSYKKNAHVMRGTSFFLLIFKFYSGLSNIRFNLNNNRLSIVLWNNTTYCLYSPRPFIAFRSTSASFCASKLASSLMDGRPLGCCWKKIIHLLKKKSKQANKHVCIKKKKQKQEAMKESPPHSKDRKISTR